jgi:hypothetical protein
MHSGNASLFPRFIKTDTSRTVYDKYYSARLSRCSPRRESQSADVPALQMCQLCRCAGSYAGKCSVSHVLSLLLMCAMAFASPVAVRMRNRDSRTTSAYPVRRIAPVRACIKPAQPPEEPIGTDKTDRMSFDPVETSALAAAAATMILKRAAEASRAGTRRSRPPASTVYRALAQLEREQKRNKAKSDVENLAGQWQLTVTGKVGRKASLLEKPQYFPVQARQTFIPDEGSGATTGVFDNGIFVAGCSLRFRGPYRWVSKVNRLEFTFSTCSLKFGPLGPLKFNNIDKEGSELGERTAKTLPFCC